MTKTKSTKRDLLMSSFALLMCVSMLIGSTFAWFTDSVSTSGNIIKSGTLDVAMEWADGTTDPDNAIWRDAGEGAIFNYDLWEPGYTEVRHIKIENKGTLALKYQLNIVANGEVSALADVIDVYYLDPARQISERTELTADMKLGTLSQVLAAISTTASGNLLAGENDTITLALKMQETAGNEYQGLSIGSDFSVQLLATQLTSESDSFDNQYDNIIPVSDVNALKSAIADGKNVMLAADMTVKANDPIVIQDGDDILLDLNGHKITGTSSEIGKNRTLFVVKGEMSVIGNGTVSQKHTGSNMEWNNLTAPFSVEGGKLTLGKGVTVLNFGGTDMAYAVDVNTTLGETELNVEGADLYSSYIGVRIFNNHNTAKGIVNYKDGIIQGAKNGYDIWAQLMSAPAENAVVNIADNINYTTEEKSGTMYYIAADSTLVSTDADLKKELESGGNVVLANDIVIKQSINLNNADFVPL